MQESTYTKFVAPNPASSTKLAASTTMAIRVSAKASAKLDDEVSKKGGSGDGDGNEDEDGDTKARDTTTAATAKEIWSKPMRRRRWLENDGPWRGRGGRPHWSVKSKAK
jgi:hypothetical protein